MERRDLIRDSVRAAKEKERHYRQKGYFPGQDSGDKSSGGPDVDHDKGSTLKLKTRGRRLAPDATTDVWTLGKFSYTGTFNNPCGGTSDEAGVHVWKSRGKNAKLVTVILSPDGSRSNDVKVASMNSGDVLVHSNESCGGGPGGVELWNVDDPANPVHLASIGPIDELNPISNDLFGGITDVGVHNTWLFTNGERDYVAVVAESAFDNFRIYDITDPTNPMMTAAWGAEEVFDPGVGDELVDVDRVLEAALWLVDGFGSSANRFLHDITITADGTLAYLSNWDAGLILLDISDPADPQLVSVALDVDNGSLDGEVNSHSAWPNEDGSIVVEGEEDFAAWEASVPPANLTLDSDFPGDPTIPAASLATTSGDDFEASQTGNFGTTDGVTVDVTSGPLAGNSYAAVELATAAGSPTFETTGPVTGELVWIGRACATSEGDPILNPGAFDPGDIAVVRRGACFFEEKADTAASLGASAVLIANNVTESTPWSGLRIWDYSDPANPVLASTFDTVCSASTAPSEECDAAGTYSSHNVVVETVHGDDDDLKGKGKGRVTAYISWYWDGVLVLDVTDPYNPVEVTRFSRTDAKFEEQNGGHQDFWGIYKVPNKKRIYASDRNGGLYVFQETGRDKD